MIDRPHPEAPSVLVIAHDLSITGGVNNFLRIMRRRLRQRVRIRRFVNGRRKGERGRVGALKRVISDYMRYIGLLLRTSFDVLHINPTLDLTSMPREFVFVWLMRLLRPKTGIIIFYRGWEWQTFERLLQSKLLLAAFVATQRRANRILVLADSFRDALINLGVDAQKIRVLSTMFEGEVLSQVLQEGIQKERGRLLFLSRFLPAKGAVLILHAVAALRHRFPHIRLVMAGDGPQRAELEQLTDALQLRQTVSYTGYIGGKEKMRELARAEIFLLPTKHPEGMPNAILEAMAAGEVIISTRVGGIPAIVADGVNGTLLDDVTTDALASAVETYLKAPTRLEAMGAANYRSAWENWESAVVSAKIADEYDQLRRAH